MTRKEIEKFSIVEPSYFKTDEEERWYKFGCIEGLVAADEEPNLESIWHNANEEPKWNELLLGEDSEGFSIYKWVGQEDCWYTFVGVCGLNRWAYIDDLLPKGGKK